MLFVSDTAARDEVRAVLGAGVNVVPPVNADPRLACDLVLEDRGLGLGHYMVRCLNDAEGLAFVPPAYFDDVIKNLSEAMATLRARQGVIISHRRVPPEAAARAAKSNIVIRHYDDFVRTRISGDRIAGELHALRTKRNVAPGVFSSLPAGRVHTGPETPVDSMPELRRFLSTSAGAALVTVLGSFGTGKTSTLLVLAHELALGELVPRDWAFPIWIHAGVIVRDDLDATLQAAFSQFSPDTPLPIDCIKRLISRGRLWLFIDALDESLALARPSDLTRLLRGLCELALPHGRVIISSRQEMFNSKTQEIDLFDRLPREWGIDNTLTLRMDRMPFETVKASLTALVGEQRAPGLIARIEASSVLRDLVTRPIFMYIASEGATSSPRDGKLGVATLFEAYVRQWSERESAVSRAPKLSSQDRLVACELLALTHQVFGRRRDGFSVEDLRDFAISDAISDLSVRNIDLFVYEARVAMFLERKEDRFDFAHASMREFFLARRASRELTEAVASGALDAVPYKAKTLGRSLLTLWLPLARVFLVELLAGAWREPTQTLRNVLNATIDWSGLTQPFQLEQTRWTETPPFGPGRHRHLIANLASLLQLAAEGTDDTIDLSGANLTLTDLTAVLSPLASTCLKLASANLDGSVPLNPSSKSEGALLPPTPNGFASRDQVHDYCVRQGLFSPSRFGSSDSIPNEFVLIPGGEYEVHQVHRNGPKGRQTVRVAAFLIQRYPVTNRQFAAFLAEYPDWEPERVRRRTSNDYYLGYWPMSPSSDLFKNEEWLDRPVVQVNWTAAAAFASASGMRLPTEVEWEIAARLGSKNFEDPRPWGPDLTFSGLLAAVTLDEKSRLDSITASRVPLHSVVAESRDVPGFVKWKGDLPLDVPSHMIGLVREWVLDVWANDYPISDPLAGYDAPVNLGAHWIRHDASELGPIGDLTPNRVLRGGGYNSPPDQLTVTYRAPHRELNVNPDVGFRCVRVIRGTRRLSPRQSHKETS